MRCRCLDQNCVTLSDAVAVIERYESILTNSAVRACDTLGSERPSNTSSTTNITQTLQRIEARLDKIEQMNKQKPDYMQQRNPKPCFGCNSFDHLWSSCPNNQAARNTQRSHGTFHEHKYNTQESYRPLTRKYTRQNTYKPPREHSTSNQQAQPHRYNNSYNQLTAGNPPQEN